MSIIGTWVPKFEELLTTGTKSVESNVVAPKLELKPLLTDLKYVFLGKDETYPVVISSKLSEVQEK